MLFTTYTHSSAPALPPPPTTPPPPPPPPPPPATPARDGLPTLRQLQLWLPAGPMQLRPERVDGRPRDCKLRLELRRRFVAPDHFVLYGDAHLQRARPVHGDTRGDRRRRANGPDAAHPEHQEGQITGSAVMRRGLSHESPLST